MEKHTLKDDDDEWKVVTRADKRRVMRRTRTLAEPPPHRNNSNAPPLWNDEMRQRVKETMSQCRAQMTATDFYRNLLRVWKEESGFHGGGTVEQMVCFGVGNLSTNSASASMWQLACALCFREFLKQDTKSDVSLLFYDPATTLAEAQVLAADWNVFVLTENECGKRAIKGVTTLFFMPHCPLLLYSNMIWSNWDELENVILFGNSLRAYQDLPCFSQKKVSSESAVSRVLPFVKEEEVKMSPCDVKETLGNFEGAFNDTFLSWFVVGKREEWPAKPDESTTMEQNDEVVVSRETAADMTCPSA